MKSISSIWFECKVRYEKTQVDGSQKAVTEQYVVDALSFAEAEARITEQLSPYISGEFEVTDVKKAAYKEIFFMNDSEKAFQNQAEDLAKAVQMGDREKGKEVFPTPAITRRNSNLSPSTKKQKRRSAATSPTWWKPLLCTTPSTTSTR